MVEYSAGIVTAYGSAKRAGYTGTYEDFCRQQAQYAQNASAVEQAKQTAVSASQVADQAKQDAQTASTQAQGASQSAQGSAQSAGQSAQNAQTAESNAQTYAQSASASAGSAQQSAQTARDVLESIPQDYSALSAEVSAINESLGNVQDDLCDKVGVISSVKGYYINLTTDPVSLTPQVSSGGISCSIVDCVEGDIFVVNAVGARSGRAWGFLDSSNHVLSMADADVTVDDLNLTAPANAVKLIINDKGGGISYKVENNLVSRVAALETAEPELSADVKTALMALASHIGVWTDGNGQGYIDALKDALYDAGTVKVFIGKGTSGSQIIDNPKRALTEPIPFKNEVPITVARSVDGEDDGYRYSVKWCVDEDTIWTTPEGFDHTGFIPLELSGWWYSSQTHTWCKDENNSINPPYAWVPDIFRGDSDGTFRIMFANLDSVDNSLPELPPKGYIIVQGKRYRLEVGDNEDFV